jgi:hypothetical protein
LGTPASSRFIAAHTIFAHTLLDGALDATVAELLWWAAALIPAREQSREALTPTPTT